MSWDMLHNWIDCPTRTVDIKGQLVPFAQTNYTQLTHFHLRESSNQTKGFL